MIGQCRYHDAHAYIAYNHMEGHCTETQRHTLSLQLTNRAWSYTSKSLQKHRVRTVLQHSALGISIQLQCTPLQVKGLLSLSIIQQTYHLFNFHHHRTYIGSYSQHRLTLVLTQVTQAKVTLRAIAFTRTNCTPRYRKHKPEQNTRSWSSTLFPST